MFSLDGYVVYWAEMTPGYDASAVRRMHLDPFTLFVANMLIAVAMSLVVLVSRVGLGPQAIGLRTWVAGDVFLLAGQMATAVDAVSAGTACAPWPPLTVSGGLFAAGVALHLAGMRRHRRAGGNPWTAVSVALAIGLLVTLVNLLLLDVVPHRGVVFRVALISMMATVMATELVPVRHFLGARVLIVALSLAIVLNLTQLAAGWLQVTALVIQPVHSQLFNMTLNIVTTAGFVLWAHEELRNRLRHAAHTDSLTGLLNRHGVMPQLKRMLAQAQRAGMPLTVVLCDLDHFKNINDTWGHATGDAVLQSTAEVLQQGVRASDLVARWGGEEFLLVFPGTSAPDAMTVVQRMQQTLSATPSNRPPITFSAGIACCHDLAALTSVEDLVALADKQLYLAKERRGSIRYCPEQPLPRDST